jgi:transmembrane sensor
MSPQEFNKIIDSYLAGTATPEEERLVDDFFHIQEQKITSPQPEYALSEEMWGQVSKKVRENALNQKRRNFSLKRILIPMAVAASIAFALFFINLEKPAEPKAEISWVSSKASRGQKSIITLADGSRIYLNSASSVSYPSAFQADKREVILEGEAFFEVAKDVNRPFIVISGGVKTQVLGTSFNINSYKESTVMVAVATGMVQVESQYLSNTDKNQVIVEPDHQAVCENGSITTSEVNIERVTAWKNQTLYFEDASMEEVARQLELWYNVSIHFDNDKIKRCTVNGQYKNQSLLDILESLGYMHRLDYKFETQTKIILYGKGCN